MTHTGPKNQTLLTVHLHVQSLQRDQLFSRLFVAHQLQQQQQQIHLPANNKDVITMDFCQQQPNLALHKYGSNTQTGTICPTMTSLFNYNQISNNIAATVVHSSTNTVQ